MKHGLLTTSELAEELHLGASTLRQYAADGRIPVAETTPGGQRRFNLGEVQAALRPQRTEETESPVFQMGDRRKSRAELPSFAFTFGKLTIAPGQQTRLQALQRAVDGEESAELPASYYSRPGSARIGMRYREAVTA